MEELLFTYHREPTDEDDRTEQINAGVAARARERRTAREQIESTYRDVWDEFYAWEPDGCQQHISALAIARPHFASTNQDVRALDACRKSGIDKMVSDEDVDQALTFNVLNLNDGAESKIVCEALQLNEHIEAHPKYESCTPSMRNVKGAGFDDPLFEGRVHFVPYAGEDGFDEIDYLEYFHVFDWQAHWPDNDVDEIAAETARRLVRITNLTFADIDKYDVIPRLISHGSSDKTDLLWRMKQRDLLHWPGYSGEENRIMDGLPDPLAQLDPWMQVNNYVNVFCPNLNCVESLCLAHRVPGGLLTAAEPHLTTQALRSSLKTPCGPLCFLMAEPDDDDIVIVENEAEQHMYKKILDLLPDEPPCTLSYLYKLPCREVFKHRCLFYPDQTIYPARETRSHEVPPVYYDDGHEDKEDEDRDEEEGEEKKKPKRHTPPDFCQHSGPCSLMTNCVCFKNMFHCRRNCRCSAKCKLRYTGCRCEKGCRRDNDEKQKACPCVERGRECDPEVCGPKPKRKKGLAVRRCKKHDCHNMNIFKNESAPLIVRRGAFGLGAFAQQKIPKGKLIGEYIAELVPDPQFNFEPFEIAKRHLKLNYVFDLNDTQVLEGATVGNETRYINHPMSNADTNVHADTKYVNGEYRIGLYSAKVIGRGEELFLDYGKGYWNEQDPPGSKGHQD